MKTYITISQLFLRLALGIGFIVPGLDRLGVWGPNGTPGVAWGDWQHFSTYAHKLLFFLPDGLGEGLAVIATIAELGFGLLLILGWQTRRVSIGSGLLLLSFAFCMTLALGIRAPLNYSVFTASAAAFVLAAIPEVGYSIDAVNRSRVRLNRHSE